MIANPTNHAAITVPLTDPHHDLMSEDFLINDNPGEGAHLRRQVATPILLILLMLAVAYSKVNIGADY